MCFMFYENPFGSCIEDVLCKEKSRIWEGSGVACNTPFNLKVVIRQECNVSNKLQRLNMHALSLN